MAKEANKPCGFWAPDGGTCINPCAWSVTENETGGKVFTCRKHIGARMALQYTYTVQAAKEKEDDARNKS